MATKIRFEDQGQDFLWWVVNDYGRVVNCGPFQASVWIGSIVPDADLLKPNDKVEFIPRNSGDVMVLKYRVQSVEVVQL